MDLFENEKKRLSKLMEIFKCKEPIEILGLVGSTGASGSKSQGEELWTVIFTLENWKYLEEGVLKNKKLTVRRIVTEKQLSEFQAEIDTNTPYRLKVKVVENSELAGAQAYLEDIIGKSTDSELLALAVELQKPVTFDDDLLGQFTLDRQVDWFTSETSWGEDEICLNLSIDSCDDETVPLNVAKELWKEQENWSKKIINFAVEELLDLKNSSWLEEGEPKLTKDQFIKKMKLKSITVHPDGEFEFWHNDGALFWGHSIQISGNLSDGPTHADIPG